ncbi:cyclase family protein [Halorubrum gandharaense]
MFQDLSQVVESGMPTYPGDGDVSVSRTATNEADGYASSELRMGTHAGTHVDAPRHMVDDGGTIDDLPVGRFAFDALLVDAHPLGPREAIPASALPAPGDAVAAEVDLLVIRTGWAPHWGTDRYRDHPYLSVEAAERCRELECGVALDAFSPDPTPPADGDAPDDEPDGTPAHDVLLGAGLPIVENLTELGSLPDRFRLYAFPLRIYDGDGSPVRAVAEWRE